MAPDQSMMKLIELMQRDSLRMDLLSAVASVDLPDWYIAAGFVRNLVWDHLHGFSSTPLNDVDVIYFSHIAIDENAVLGQLLISHPDINWQVKNQAFMHIRNGDPPYKNSVHAMEFWPEIETALGAKLNSKSELVFASPFDISTIFEGYVTHNPRREKAIFLKRIEDKSWLTMWSKLQIRV